MSGMSRRPKNNDEDQPESSAITDEERFRRWFVCPFVGCNTIAEFDAREKAPHYCGSDQHPAAKMRMFFGGRMVR